MSVIAFVNQKGGCAKSTTAVHLAYWLMHRQSNVLVIDADAQGSSSIWIESLEDAISCKVMQQPDNLLRQIPELASQYDYVVIDGPAGLSETTKAIIFVSDFAVIPCQPTGVDLRSASDAIRIIQQAQAVRNGAPKAAVLLTRAVRGTRLKDEAIAQLNSMEVPILNTVIHQRQAIADTFGQAATVWELLGKAAVEAAEEFDVLFREIMEMVP